MYKTFKIAINRLINYGENGNDEISYLLCFFIFSDVEECSSNQHAGLLTFFSSYVNECLNNARPHSYAVCNFVLVFN